jgi:hypothetical protein
MRSNEYIKVTKKALKLDKNVDVTVGQMVYLKEPKKRKGKNKQTNPVGSPLIYTDQEIIAKAKEFIEKNDETTFPSVIKFARSIGYTRKTIYQRAATCQDLSDTLEEIKELQEDRLVSNGLVENWNSGFAKFLLSANHGMKEKSEVESKNENTNHNYNTNLTPDEQKDLDAAAREIGSTEIPSEE